MQLVVGPLSDRLGRRPVLICGMLLFVLSTLCCALTTEFDIFVLARFVQGTTVCFVIVAGYASIHELFEQARAIHILARMGSVVVLAPALGPLIGGLIVSHASWRWTFWPLFILGLITLILLIKWMPEPLPPEKRQPLKLGILLKQYRSLLNNRRFLLLVLAYCAIFSGFIAWLAAGPFLVIQAFQYPPYVFGFYQILILGAFIVSNQLVKSLMETLGIQTLILRGFACTLIGGMLAIGSAFLLPKSLSGLVLGMTLYSFGFGFSAAPVQRLAIEAASEPMGSRMALLSTIQGTAAFLATLWIKFTYNGQLSSLAFLLVLTALFAPFSYLLETILKKANQSLAD